MGFGSADFCAVFVGLRLWFCLFRRLFAGIAVVLGVVRGLREWFC